MKKFLQIFFCIAWTLPVSAQNIDLTLSPCVVASQTDQILNRLSVLSGIPNPETNNGLTPEALRVADVQVCQQYLRGFVAGQRMSLGESGFSTACEYISRYGTASYASLMVAEGYGAEFSRYQAFLTWTACNLVQ